MELSWKETEINVVESQSLLNQGYFPMQWHVVLHSEFDEGLSQSLLNQGYFPMINTFSEPGVSTADIGRNPF